MIPNPCDLAGICLRGVVVKTAVATEVCPGEALSIPPEGPSAGFGVDQGCQEDVPEPVQADAVEVGVGEIELEPPSEVFDPLLQFIPAQGGDRRYELFKLSLRAHGFGLAKKWSSSESARCASCPACARRRTHDATRNTRVAP